MKARSYSLFSILLKCRWVDSNHRLRLMRAAHEASSATPAKVTESIHYKDLKIWGCRGSNPDLYDTSLKRAAILQDVKTLVHLSYTFGDKYCCECIMPIADRYSVSSPGEIRTHTVSGLSRLPLPIGVLGYLYYSILRRVCRIWTATRHPKCRMLPCYTTHSN